MLNNPWILGGGPIAQVNNQMDGLGGSGSGHMVLQTQSVSIASSDGSVIHQTNTYESWVTVTGPQPVSVDICPGQSLFSSIDMGAGSTITTRAADAFLALPMQTEALPAVSMQSPFVAHNQVEPMVALPTQMTVSETPLVAAVQNPAETFIAVPVPPTCDPLVAVPAVQSLYNPLVGTSESSVPMIHTAAPQTTQTNMPSWYLVVQDIPDSAQGVAGISGPPSVVRTDEDLFLCVRCNSTFEKVSCINWHLRECKGSAPFSNANSVQVKTLMCSMCARVFTVLHEPSSSFVCSDCSSRNIPLTFPAAIMPVMPFTCSECGDCFQFEYELEDHRTSHQSSVTICELPDNYMEENGNEEDDVSVIVEPTVETPEDNDESGSLVSDSSEDVESDQSRPEICGECGDSFSCLESLNNHVKSHGNLRSYGCTKCGIICVGRYSLNRHVWVHDRESEDKENVADSCFELQEGNAKDGVAQPFGCTECGMQFSDSNNLKEHCVSHLRSKPFLCTRCGEKFDTTNSLERHWEAHIVD